MIIDFHTHIFPDKLAPKVIPHLQKRSKTKAFSDGTLVGLQNSMTKSSVDISMIMPVASDVKQVVSCNDFASKVNQSYDNFISFGAMHPDFCDYKSELLRIKNMGILGIKLHPNYQDTYFDDIRYKRIIDCASSLDLIILVHAGVDVGLPEPIYSTPQNIKNLVCDVRPEKLVLAHMGSWQMWEQVNELLSGENVYIDTAFSLGNIHYLDEIPQNERVYSMMSDEMFLNTVKNFGEDKVLFATDSPWSSQQESVEYIKNCALSEGQKSKILGENAKKLLGI